MDLLSQSSLLVGVTSFALGASLLARNVRNKLFLTFAGLAMVISAWALAFFLEKIWGGGSFYRWHLFFNVWIAPSGLWFILTMVKLQDRLSRWLLDAALLVALMLSVAILFGYDTVGWVRQLIYFIPGVIVFQLLRLMGIDRRQRTVGERPSRAAVPVLGRRTLIYLGGLLVLATSIMDHVDFVGQKIPFVGNLGLTVYLFFLGQAVSQQRLLNFEALLSRFLVLLAIALMLTAVYSMLFAWIQASPALFFLNSFIVSFLLVTLLEPIRSLVSYLTQRLVTQKHRRLQEVLREGQRKLTGIIDRATLFQAILSVAEQTLQPKWASIFVLTGDGTKYRRLRFYEWEPDHAGQPVPREIIANHPLLQYCQRLKRRGDVPVILDQVLENEVDRSASRAQRDTLRALIEGLRALNANLLFPMFDGGKILAFAALRVPDPPEPWGNNWGLLPMLSPYFEQAGEALKNMEIFVRQREKERLAAVGEMAAGLAHEIRNPLGAIKGAAQFLDPSADRPDSRFLRVIVEEVDRLNHVVTQFLDYSKPPTTDFSAVALEELVPKSANTLRAGLPASVRLEVLVPAQPLRVMGSAAQIHQVLINLIQNSVKALEGVAEGSIRVSVEPAGGEVTIAVEDNGKGIRKENLEKLFIPFFTTSPSGTGLGLSISQKIIEAHRGRIEVASEEGRFTRFSVVLPLLMETQGA
ncbi:MAG: ATP-binding protein [Oligoflexia bacterium]|nr:ATP-binding protein [Oligoflexia bacterium]